MTWTGCLESSVPFASLKEWSEMRAIGRDFGMGLQLVNILCDAGADLAAGGGARSAVRLSPAGPTFWSISTN